MECKKSLKCLYEDKVILLRIAIFMPRSALDFALDLLKISSVLNFRLRGP